MTASRVEHTLYLRSAASSQDGSEDAIFASMSTHCTTAIIDRRPNRADGETIVTYFRHHDGYPRGHGAHLVELIMEIAADKPERLIEAIDSRWRSHRTTDGTAVPLLERTGSHAHWDGLPYRYDVIYECEGRQTTCRVECFTRKGGQGGDYLPETSPEWLELQAKLNQAVSLWPLAALGPSIRGRLSGLSA